MNTTKSVSPVAIITGAGTGIGEATAVTLAGQGYRLALAGRRPEPLERVAGLIVEAGGTALTQPTDVADPESVAVLFGRIEDELGRCDLLFNNAGSGTPPVPMEDLTFEQWTNCVGANLTGSFLCAQHAIRMMKAQSPGGGRIVNNGSISAHTPRPHSAPYTSTKHAITGLTKSISLDGREHNICCSQIDIGNAATPMTEPMAQGVPQPDGSVKVEARMDVQYVADAVAWIAQLPLDTNVLNLTVMANGMPFVGRG